MNNTTEKYQIQIVRPGDLHCSFFLTHIDNRISKMYS